MPNVEITLQTVLLVIAVLLLVANVVSTLNKGKKDWAELSGVNQRREAEETQNARLKDLEDWRACVDRRLREGDVRFEDTGRDTMEILLVLRSMIRHMQSGNDHDKLQATDDKLYNYLVEKRGVNPRSLT